MPEPPIDRNLPDLVRPPLALATDLSVSEILTVETGPSREAQLSRRESLLGCRATPQLTETSLAWGMGA